MLPGIGEPVTQREGRADPGRAAQGSQPAPPQPQADDVGEALAGMQPQVQADPQVAGAVAGQVRGGQERPRREGDQDQDDGQRDGELDHHRGSPFRAARTALRRAVRAEPVLRSTWGARAAAIPATRSSGIEARDPCRSVTKIREAGRLARPRDPAGCGGDAGRVRRDAGRVRRGRQPGPGGLAAAGGDWALLQDPGAEPGQGGDGRQGQAQQPQDQPAGHGQRRHLLGDQGTVQVLRAGGRGPHHPDERVAGQGVGDRRHRPHGQVPPAGGGRDRVHEHAGADRGEVQDPGPDRPPAVQGQRDPEAGEYQGGGIGDRGLQPGHHRQPPGGIDQPVLRGETHHRRGRSQQAQPGSGIPQPDAQWSWPDALRRGRSGAGRRWVRLF